MVSSECRDPRYGKVGSQREEMGVGERRWCGREEAEWVKVVVLGESWQSDGGWRMAEVCWGVGEKGDGGKGVVV